MSMSERLKPGTGVILWNDEPVYYETSVSDWGNLVIAARILGDPNLLPITTELQRAIEEDLSKCADTPVSL